MSLNQSKSHGVININFCEYQQEGESPSMAGTTFDKTRKEKLQKKENMEKVIHVQHVNTSKFSPSQKQQGDQQEGGK
jgi:hypothetical protein